MPPPPKNILILGAGAIGAFYGSLLSRLSHLRVSVVCRSNYRAVAEHGFRITSPQFGQYTWRPKHVFSTPVNASDSSQGGLRKWDYVVVTTKALPGIADGAELLTGLVGKDSKVVLIQNGLGVESPYVTRWAEQGVSVLSAVTIASCAQTSPGVVVHNRWTKINVAPFACEAGTGREFVQWLAEVLGGEKYALYEEEKRMQWLRWHKCAINAAMNPSSVLSGGAPSRDMARDEEFAEHVRGVIAEVLSVGSKVLGEDMPADLATPEQIVKSTSRNDTDSVPSMQQDWARGGVMELQVILGEPIRRAREVGVLVPRLQSVFALISMKERRRDAGHKL